MLEYVQYAHKASFGRGFEDEISKQLAVDFALNAAGFRSAFRSYQFCTQVSIDLVALSNRLTSVDFVGEACGDITQLQPRVALSDPANEQKEKSRLKRQRKTKEAQQ